MKARMFRKWGACLLTAAMILSMNGISTIHANAAKAPKLSKTSVTIKAGASTTVKVKNLPSKAKQQWTSKNKKVAKVNKKGKITGVKQGKTVVTCKLTYKKGSKKIKKSLSVKVKVKEAAKATTTPVVSSGAAISSAPVASSAPATSSAVAPTAAPANESTAAPANVPSAAPAGDSSANVVKGDKDTLLKMSNVGDAHKSKNGADTKDTGVMRPELTTTDLIDNVMGIGWDYGNSLEESNADDHNATIAECETNAGNTAASQTTFTGLHKYGVNTVRVPIAWSNLMSKDGNYTINEDLFNRVEEVINYGLNEGMYVIINEHWDGGWWGMFGSPDENVRKEAWKKYEAMWTQIADRYSEYSDHLIFEAGNEEISGAFPSTNNWGLNTRVGENGFLDTSFPQGTLTKEEIYKTATEISQKFVDIVRSSGGNNKYRHLLIPGNTTGIDEACDPLYVMPTDIAENGNTKLSIDVHPYIPQGYALSATASDEGYVDNWNASKEERDWLKGELAKMDKYSSQGYGVIAGECGVVKPDKNGIPLYMQWFFKYCKAAHITPVLWDEGHYFNRAGGYFDYADYGKAIADAEKVKTVKVSEDSDFMIPADLTLPEGAELKLTGINKPTAVENQNPKVIYTWEGEFMRHATNGAELKETRADLTFIVDDKGVVSETDCGVGRTDKVTNADGVEGTIERVKEDSGAVTDKVTFKDADGNVTDEVDISFNNLFWHSHFKCDWSKIEKPCIKVTPMDNAESKKMDLQLFCSDGKVFFTQYDYQSDWQDLYFEISEKDKAMLDGEERNWLGLTTNDYNGASFVKVEICDAAYNADGTKAN